MIATGGRERLLGDTVESILRGSELPAEIVVVDQTANEGEAPDHEHPLVRRLRTRPLGVAAARNLGASESRGEAIVFCDDDMLVEVTWLERLLDTLAAGGPRTVATGRVLPGAPELPHAIVPATVLGEESARYAGRLPVDVLAGGSMAMFRSTFAAVGGFDPRLGPGTRYGAAEDNDLGFRLLERGCEIVYVADAVVIHRAWRGRRDYLRLRWRYGRGKGGFYAKHASFHDRHMLRRAARDVGSRIAAFPKRVIVTKGRAVGDVAYSAGVVTGMIEWLAREPRRAGHA